MNDPQNLPNSATGDVMLSECQVRCQIRCQIKCQKNLQGLEKLSFFIGLQIGATQLSKKYWPYLAFTSLNGQIFEKTIQKKELHL